ncbi:hypothetical protein [Streptomyces profundus]|uniref:hypothetical protein n=1 Tax=Streptomyces profundus TaxID=2867410 RepID=UPI001D166DEE|nr:hypothetical protein [Streptomyces sp. MA3_2.13]UED86615.1 hypothetical protein K4G22_22460 [Streptomyces sp. MA3_2.13]
MTSNGGWRVACGAGAAALLVALGLLVRDADATPVDGERHGPAAGERGDAIGAPPDQVWSWPR